MYQTKQAGTYDEALRFARRLILQGFAPLILLNKKTHVWQIEWKATEEAKKANRQTA